MTDDAPLAPALVILRITLGVFFLLWAAEKILMPEISNLIGAAFYGFTLPMGVVQALGVAQVLLVLAFAAGMFRTVTYGLMLLFHAGSTLSTWAILIDPYGRTASGIPHHLFLAAIPTLGAILALFLLRRRDTMFRVPIG
ncbi:MAG: DoxX protein [Pseudomonadota bacterium]